MPRVQTGVDRIRDIVNTGLRGITDEQVVVRFFTDIGSPLNALRRAGGGSIPGSGNRDTVPILATPGEYVLRKAAVRKLGPDWLDYLNRTGKVPPFHEYRSGGPVLQTHLEPFTLDFGPTVAAVRKAMVGNLGTAGAPGRYQAMYAAVRSVFPGTPLISGFRPGAITATGRPSYHGMGRAVDLPPRMPIFDWIRATFGRNTKELIFTPAGGRQINNGRPHVYTGITARNHIGHIHWAMRLGGLVRAMRLGGLVDKMHTGGGVGFRPGREVAAFLERGEGVMSLRAMAHLDDALRSVSTAASGPAPGGSVVVHAPVHVHPSPGMDETALAHKVGDVLGRRADLLNRGG